MDQETRNEKTTSPHPFADLDFPGTADTCGSILFAEVGTCGSDD